MEQLLNGKVGKEVEMMAEDTKGLAASKVPACHSAADLCGRELSPVQ